MKQGEIYVVFTADKKSLDKAISETEIDLQRVEKSASNTSSNVSNLGSRFGDLAKKVTSISWNVLESGAAVSAAALTTLATKGILSANQLQTLQISMNGLTGSMELGAKAMAGAYQYAQKAPFQLPEVAGTTKTLIAYGLSAEKAVASLQTLGNVSIASGIDISRLGDIFGQVASRGYLMQGDIQNLVQNGVGIVPALGKSFNLSAAQIEDAVAKHEISFDKFEKALEGLVDPSILEQLTNTLPRQIDRFGGSVRILSNAFVGVGVDAVNGFTMASDGISQAVINIVKNTADSLRSPAILQAASSLGNSFVPILQSISGTIQPIMSGITSIAQNFSTLGAVALPVLGLLVGSLSGVVSDVPILGKLVGGLTGPIGLIAGSIAALIALSPELRAGLGNSFEILGGVFTQLQPVLGQILDSFVMLAKDVGSTLAPVLPILAEAFGDILKALLPIIPVLGGALSSIVKALAPVLVVLAGAFLQIVKAIIPLVGPLTQVFVQIINDIIIPILPTIIELIRIFATVITQVLTAITPLIPPLLQLVTALIAGIAPILPQVAALFLQLVQAIIPILPPLVELITLLLPPLIAFLRIVIAVASVLANTFSGVLTVAITTIVGAIGLLIQWVSGGISAFNAFGSQVNASVTSLYNRVAEKISGVINTISGMVSGITGMIRGFYGDMTSAGRNIIDGLIKGVSSGTGDLINKIKDICKDALGEVKKFFGIHSPSRVMEKMGLYMGAGWSNGILGSASNIMKSVKSLNNDVLSGFSTSLYPSYSVSGGYSINSDDTIGDTTKSGGVTINQTNNNYQEQDIDKANLELAYRVNL